MTISTSPMRDDDKFVLKTERALLLKDREEELLAEMIQLYKVHAEMKKQTAEAVEAAGAGLKKLTLPVWKAIVNTS